MMFRKSVSYQSLAEGDEYHPPTPPEFLAADAVDFTPTGMAFRHYRQPSVFTRQSQAPPEYCAVIYDPRCATGLQPTGGVSEGGGSAPSA